MSILLDRVTKSHDGRVDLPGLSASSRQRDGPAEGAGFRSVELIGCPNCRSRGAGMGHASSTCAGSMAEGALHGEQPGLVNHERTLVKSSGATPSVLVDAGPAEVAVLSQLGGAYEPDRDDAGEVC